MVLSDISIQRPVLAIVVNALLVVFGLFAFSKLPVREYPAVDPPVVSISTTYEGASAEVIESQITQVMEGAVSGIEGARCLSLPTQTETLVTLPQGLDIRYTILEGKFAGSTMYGGRVVKLATRTAELQVDQPVAAFSNLKLHLLRPTGEMVPGELFAKVVETLPAARVVVRFTSISEAALMFLDTMKVDEYLVPSWATGGSDRPRGSD